MTRPRRRRGAPADPPASPGKTPPGSPRDPSPEWVAFRASRRDGYLGKLELLSRLFAQLEGEQATAMVEAQRYGASVADIAEAAGVTTTVVRQLLKA